MARVELTDDEALALGGLRDVVAQLTLPTPLKFDSAADLMRVFSRVASLASGAGSQFEVFVDDSAAMSVGVGAGRCTIGGVPVAYAGEVIDLSAYDGDTAYVWLEDDGGGDAQVGVATDATGWPGTAHLRLAEVTVADGAIASSGLVDWRGAALFVVSSS